jgi:hypothetical protein
MSDHDELRSLLGRIRRRWFALTALSTGARASLAAAIPLFLVALAAWLTRPAGTGLVVLVAAALVASCAAVGIVLFRMQRRPDDGRVARFIEEQSGADQGAPAFCDSLVSAVEVAGSPARYQSGFGPLIVSDAIRALRTIEPSAVISAARMRRAAAEAMVGLAVFGAAVTLALPHLVAAGAMAWVAAFPGSIDIAVVTGDARVPAGHPLRIAATVRGRAATLLSVVPALVVAADGQQRSVAMQRSGDEFVYAFESIDRSFQYRVTAGAASSPAYAVTALFPARVQRIDVHYEYPSFSGLPPRDEQDGGDIFGPAGTRVRLSILTDKPVHRGEIVLTGGGPVALQTGQAAANADLVLTRDDAYRVRLTDVDGLHSQGELEYFIRVMDDRPPDVRIVRPSADQGITPLEEVVIEARADDDHGVASFELVYGVAGRPPRTVPFSRVSGTDVARVGSHLVAAEDLRVQPGDVITYYARVRDVARGKRSTETRSDIFFLEVKPFSEEFVAAQSQAMGAGAAATQIDGLIAAQKEIINATWNLERRSAAGRSAADVKAVGEAQAELKQRIERMALGGRRGGRGAFPPQQTAPLPARGRRDTADPVAAAVVAMGRAVEQLERESTADALPHEMAALQGLLRAQAEVRRREVMQQSSAGAGQGGTSRSDRDLSALFDRELQRQQRTNYETPQQSTERTPQDDSDALERIRDLARRQEELARRQRELATAALAEHERRRQLEQLTREQQELRQDAEALEKQMRGASGASRTGEAGQIRRAAEQMQNAAKEMQRQNTDGAASSGEKAAESLRQTERQLRGGSAEARQRAAGDLRLEAQQVADAQRRIAAEMSRLEKDGQQASGDALRRIAGEKDKLADRVDELERGVRELERATTGAAGTPFRDAARQLQGAQVGARMRATAKELRERAGAAAGAGRPQPNQTQAEAEQQLSRALDGIVDRLGGVTQADARLTEELDSARRLRERLDQLERRVREAEATARAGGSPAAPSPGRAQQGQRGGGGEGSPQQQLQRAREEYSRELGRARDSLAQAQPRGGLAGSTPEQHEYSRSAPGNESFKQDFSNWESLRKDVDLRLDRYEAAVSARLTRKAAGDRLSVGGSDRVPELYRESVSRYFEALAKARQ